MYWSEDIQKRLHEHPFKPFRIIASEGLRYEVRHPELVLVGSRDVMVGEPSRKNPTVYDQVTRVALLHIVALEDLEAPVPPGNGDQGN